MPARPRFLNLNGRAWRQLRGSWHMRPSPALLWHSWVSGPLNGATDWLQSHAVGAERAASAVRGSIFILGYWRSGTTLLHELLCRDPRFAFPTTYACMNPHHFILNQPAARKGAAIARPMDGLVVRNDSPQEGEFALLSLGARSPYEALIVPRILPQALALGDPDDLPPRDRAQWEHLFLQFLHGVSLAGHGRPLILKSPTHGYRVATIRSCCQTPGLFC